MKMPQLLICAVSPLVLHGCAAHLEPSGVGYTVQSPVATIVQQQDARRVDTTRTLSSGALKPARVEGAGARQRLAPAVAPPRAAGQSVAILVAQLIDPRAAPAAAQSEPALVRDDLRVPQASHPLDSELRHLSARENGSNARDSVKMALLLAVGLGWVVVAAGAFVYWKRRRPPSITLPRAIGGFVTSGAAAVAFALYLLPDTGKRSKPEVSPPPEAAAVPAASPRLLGTYVCGEATAVDAHATHTVLTRKYYPDWVYVDMAQSWSERTPTVTAISIGTFDLANDSKLILREVAASPDVMARKPIVRTAVLIEQQLSENVGGKYSSRRIRQLSSGQPQRVADVTEHCRTAADEVAATMDELREALKRLLP